MHKFVGNPGVSVVSTSPLTLSLYMSISHSSTDKLVLFSSPLWATLIYHCCIAPYICLEIGL